MKTYRLNFRHFQAIPQWLRHIGRSAIYSICLVTAAVAGPVTKNPEPVEPLEPWRPGTITTGVKGNDAYIDGHFSITAPIYSTLGAEATLSGDLVFLEPYISYGEGGEVATSLGLGWRHLFGTQPVSALTQHDGHQAGFMEEGWFIGANVFVDMLDTETDHQFWQLGVGAEIGNRYIELRGNYYIPLTDKQEVDRFRTRQSFSSSSSSQSTAQHANDPFATGNTVQQAYTQSVFATTTTRTTTIERLFRRYEEGMEGWDAEIAFLVPGLDKYMDLRLIAGYYSFQNQPFGPQAGGTGDIEGWKAGVELRPVPALILSGMWYEDDRLTGSDWTVGVQMQIPFEAGDLGDGKNFWSRIGDSFKPRRRHLAERMAEPVRRQNAAIKLAGGTAEDKKAREVTTKVKKVTKLVSQSQHQIVLKDDIIFVNNGGPVGNGIQAGSAAGDGTAEKPLVDIQAGGNRAQVNSQVTNRVWNVYTQGTAGGYTENVIANTGSVNFIGSGKLIPGIGGKSFGAGPAPAVNGGFLADGIAHFGVQAYHITGGYFGDYGIGTHNVEFAHLSENTLVSTLGGIALRVDGTAISKAIVEGNTMHNNTLSGVSGQASDQGRLEAVVQNNRITNMGNSGVTFSFEDISRGLVDILNNEIQTTADHGIDVQAIEGTRVSFVVNQNRITGAQDSGLSARSINSAVMVLNANQNVIQQSANQAIDLLANDATLTAALSGNQLLNSGGHGILATSDFGISRLFLRATGNTIDVTGKDGMSLQAPTGLPGSALTARLVGNQITNTGLAGVNVLGADDHVLDIQLSGNIVDKTATHGVYLKNQNGGVLTANLDGNSISNTGDAAVYLDDNGGKSTLLLADGNILDNAMNSAVLIYAQSTANVTATFTNNHISKSDGDGIELLGRGTSQITFLAADNTITGNAVEAIGAGLEDSATGVFEIVSNSLLGNAAAQLYFRAEDTATLGLTARGNQISDGTDGASVADILNNATASLVYEDNVILNQMYGIQVLGNANTQATVTGNEITNTLSYGIDVRDTQTVTISRNTIAGIGAVNSEYGIHARAGVGGVLEISNNTVVGGGGVGISVTGGDSSTSTIKSNTIKENLGGGIVVETNDAVSAVFEIVGNQLDDNHQHAIAAYSNDTSSADVTVSGNFINTTFFGSGIHLEALDTSTMTGMALNNFIDDSDRSGVFLISRNGATAHFTVTGNTATQTNNSAIQTFSSGTSIMTANIQNNSLLGTRGNVIYVESLDTSNQKVTIAGNTVVGSDFVGLTVNGLFNSTLNVVWDNNSISDVARLGGSAIWVREASGTTTLDSNVNNVVVPNTNAGLLLESDGNVSGTIILNGAPVVLPATIP